MASQLSSFAMDSVLWYYKPVLPVRYSDLVTCSLSHILFDWISNTKDEKARRKRANIKFYCILQVLMKLKSKKLAVKIKFSLLRPYHAKWLYGTEECIHEWRANIGRRGGFFVIDKNFITWKVSPDWDLYCKDIER